MNKTIICDQCGYEGCTVSELVPESRKISMKDVARQGKSPYEIDQWQSDNRDRTWLITCGSEHCGYVLQYIQRANFPHFRFPL
jgi:hypothetical protein